MARNEFVSTSIYAINAAHRLASPVESLLQAKRPLYCDVLIVGSGYGGSFAAMELAATGQSVWVMEKGREYALGEFPETLGDLPGHVQYHQQASRPVVGNPDALFSLQVGKHVTVVTGCGLGGTSLINASVALTPPDRVFQDERWPRALRADLTNLKTCFADAHHLLGTVEWTVAGQTSKYRALQQLAKAIPGSHCQPLTLAIAPGHQESTAGMMQAKCTQCGNCVTGCNVGAKNTLPMNVIPLACQAGARFYTGATAQTIRPARASDQYGLANGAQWVVQFARTATLKCEEGPDEFEIVAKTVILAGGSLGSTEILLRSQTANTTFSKQLGRHFSGNGDFLAFGYAQRRAVNAFGHSQLSSTQLQQIGPTAVGMIRAVDPAISPLGRYIIEDGAIPSVLGQILGPILANASLLQRFISDQQPAWFAQHANVDPLTVHESVLAHTQVLLCMGQDSADGELYLGQQGIDIEWPTAPRHSSIQQLHHVLTQAHLNGGMDGGDYLPNPQWRNVPEAFEQIVGQSTTGSLVTAHPLGGCAMGNNATLGVVDHLGRVFDGADHAGLQLHQGLYVLDSAILPCPVEVNPFITLSGVVLRAVRILTGQTYAARAIHPPRQPYRTCIPTASPHVPVLLSLRETLFNLTPILLPPDWRGAVLAARTFDQLQQHATGLIAQIQIELDMLAWLANPSIALPATITLHCPAQTSTRRGKTVGDGPITAPALFSGHGTVRLLALDEPIDGKQAKARTDQALAAFLKRRGLRDLFLAPGQQTMRSRLRSFLRIARIHSQWRRMDYRFTLLPIQAGHGSPLMFSGFKQLAYQSQAKNPWTSLQQLQVTLTAPGITGQVSISLQVDVLRMLRQHALQVTAARNTPVAMSALLQASHLLMRIMFATHFWTFRGLRYRALRSSHPARIQSLLLRNGQHIDPVRHTLHVPRQAGDDTSLPLSLTCYLPASRHPLHPPILLTHGLAHGGEIFTTHHSPCAMAAWFAEQGRVVWVFDHRYSNRTMGVGQLAGSLDELAQFDLPAAVRFVYEQHESQPIDLFAHCIGAAGVTMAVLNGRIWDTCKQQSMIGKLALHAVPPWPQPSTGNRIMAALLQYVDELLGAWTLQASPGRHPEQLDQWIDRLAESLPLPDSEQRPNRPTSGDALTGYATANRMALFYGHQWRQSNLTPALLTALPRMMGPLHLDVIRHMLQITERGMLLDRFGNPCYLQTPRFAEYWTFPTLLVHGLDNQVFDAQASIHSALALHRILPKGRSVQLLAIPQVGHLDLVFGKHAAQPYQPHLSGSGVFPALQQFFDGQPLSIPLRRLAWQQLKQHGKQTPPLEHVTGPSFHYRIHAGRQLELISCIEQTTLAATPPIPPRLRGAQHNGRVYDYTAAWAPTVILPGQYWLLTTRVDPLHPPVSLQIGLRRRKLPRHPAGNKSDQWVQIPLHGMPWFTRLIGYLQGKPPRQWRILAASCRWPGTPFEREAVDRIFAAMLQLAQQAPGVDGLWLLGDQIYANAGADVLRYREHSDRYARRYREAFGDGQLGLEQLASPHFAALLRSIPTWMVIDDHELEDNWPGRDKGQPFNVQERQAMAAVLAYQHRQLGCEIGPPPPLEQVRYWHAFEVCGLPAFAIDTRSERERRHRTTWPRARLLGQTQFHALTTWLEEQQRIAPDRPKLILSGSVFGFPRRHEVDFPATCVDADHWQGYPRTWRALVRFIVSRQITHVIFVCGDLHAAAVANLTLRFGRHSPVRAHTVVLSGLNATLPFANARQHQFMLDMPVRLPMSNQTVSVDSTLHWLTDAYRQFGCIDVCQDTRGWQVTISIRDPMGVKLAETRLYDRVAQALAGQLTSDVPVSA
ncbi:alpha/beta fold hydrolase [Chitinivorax sp. B]|uniref:alpha/beta fold hydrolase n=1 Tax=Chitinivorax sp. B TaxID=2502235 RepID=UPI0014857953|nr:alpha/beta fold hydrolase [Chitinivorax sp. B]